MPQDQAFHAASVTEALAALGSSKAGLTSDEAARRLAAHGPNRLPEPPRRTALSRLLSQFNNLLIQVLLVAALVTMALGHWVDGQVILAVVLVNTVIGFIQEGKAERALDAIRHMLSPLTAVLRDGRRLTVPGADLVPGDMVLLEAGDRVPADLRLLETSRLTIDEAVLTGESVPVTKRTEPVAADAPLGDRIGMAFSGTLVTAGQGRGLVVATGPRTEIGHISGLIATVPRIATPLLRQMQVLARWVTFAILGFGALILLLGTLLANQSFADLFMAVVALSVAAIPEGLPAILTITLALGVQGMARRNAIVRRLPAIEALGSVSVICTDKTGTLTRNEMMVSSLILADGAVGVSGAGYAPDGDFALDGRRIDPEDLPVLAEIAEAGLLCSDATLHHTDGLWRVEGDPMEGALVVLARKAGIDPDTGRMRTPRTDAIPFDAQYRFMATLVHDHGGHGRVLVKGAPERVLDMCDRQRSGSGQGPLDRRYWLDAVERIAADGQRVLALAMRDTRADQTTLEFSDVDCGLTLLGLVGLIDPPRDEAIAAVADCRAAGVRVKMITGDHAGTAAAIARRLGLNNPRAVLTGRDIDMLDDAALRARVADTDVFARTSPEHKLRLVQALQADGAAIAMTGDGVNDAPALKRADIGVAMGNKGSEAAKEAAEIVLADDNFSTIAAAIRAGRTVYDNLKKAIVFLLPINGGESVSLVLAILLGLTLPITPVQILWVNMVSSVALALALAFEPAEPDVMRRPPRPAGEAMLTGFLLWRVAFVSTLFAAGIFGMFTLARMQGASLDEARTLAVNTLVAMEVFYLFSVRSLNGSSLTWKAALGTKAVLAAVGLVTLLQAGFTYLPVMATFFGSRPLSVGQVASVIGVGIAILLILEIEKLARRRLGLVPSATGAGV